MITPLSICTYYEYSTEPAGSFITPTDGAAFHFASWIIKPKPWQNPKFLAPFAAGMDASV
jgi:hypothetical protein